MSPSLLEKATKQIKQMWLKVIWISGAAAAALTATPDNVLERAEIELDKELFRLTMNGAMSPRFSRKKVTAMWDSFCSSFKMILL